MATVTKARSEYEDKTLRRIVSATRLHLPPDAEEVPEVTQEHLAKFAVMAQKLGVTAAIAVNSHEEAVRELMRAAAPDLRFHVLHVPYWGAFVPALNALLTFGQRMGMRYILYQSLEVLCTPTVLDKLLDHFTADTLVVGPVLDGHCFKAGERPLNGRSAPWNTLALWSVRKLALTGFLQIADGLPDVPPSIGREEGLAVKKGWNPQESEDLDEDEGINDLMGSNDWWETNLALQRQVSELKQHGSVPAGVEEVTAIALLQHLHGSDRARAVLLRLPPELERQLSWAADWGKDEGRKKWHQYKMASKVTRPQAQLQELFRNTKNSSTGDLVEAAGNLAQAGSRLLQRRGASFSGSAELGMEAASTASASSSASTADTDRKEVDAELPQQEEQAKFGTVMHYGESIPPPSQVHLICLTSCVLWFANSTAVLASAFRHINAPGPHHSMQDMAFVALLIGGVYLPMPLSLWLTKTVTGRAGHQAGLALFGGSLLAGHLLIVASQVLGIGSLTKGLLLTARMVQGLGSGVLFQVRFVLASLSTNDRHVELQSQQFMMSDLGLGLGALLPAAIAMLAGSQELKADAPELLPSCVLAFISFLYLVWVFMAFPQRLPILPDRVRFPAKADGQDATKARSGSKVLMQANRSLLIAWVSGTTRVFVQSAVLPAVALSMREANWTGNFRQTYVCAALCLLPMPFEAFVSSICCTCSFRAKGDYTHKSKMAYGAIGVVALVIASLAPRNVTGEDGEFVTLLARPAAVRICELAILVVALGMAAPFNASQFYRHKDAERSIVLLEWMKAYIGRLLGPFFAVATYTLVGYFPLLVVLSLATLLVGVTA